MKKVLVTGGAGFIGSHLCERLLIEGNYVICLDNFFTGRKDNVCHLISNKKFEIINHDIIDSFFLDVDEIYNLASPAAVNYKKYNAIETMKTNFIGTLNMLELAQKTDSKILQASTSEVYGDPLEHPQSEEYWGNVNSVGIRASYDESKRVSETLTMDYYRMFNVDVRIIRIFNTYGPRMTLDGRVISNFFLQALSNQDITVYGDGSQTRSFCYVEDLVDGMIKMMNNYDFIGPVNLGNTEEFTIKELAEIILELTDSKSRIIYKDLPKDDPQRRQPDITLAKTKLDWQPKVDLKEGLIRTIKYYEKSLIK